MEGVVDLRNTLAAIMLLVCCSARADDWSKWPNLKPLDMPEPQTMTNSGWVKQCIREANKRHLQEMSNMKPFIGTKTGDEMLDRLTKTYFKYLKECERIL